MSTNRKSARAKSAAAEMDEALDDAAQGVTPTSDEPADDDDQDDDDEIDAIGEAAGIPSADGKPLGGPDKIARRDAHRWELDPASAEDAGVARGAKSTSNARSGRRPPHRTHRSRR